MRIYQRVGRNVGVSYGAGWLLLAAAPVVAIASDPRVWAGVLVVAGAALFAWLFGAVRHAGHEVPDPGCRHCHRDLAELRERELQETREAAAVAEMRRLRGRYGR